MSSIRETTRPSAQGSNSVLSIFSSCGLVGQPESMIRNGRVLEWAKAPDGETGPDAARIGTMVEDTSETNVRNGSKAVAALGPTSGHSVDRRKADPLGVAYGWESDLNRLPSHSFSHLRAINLPVLQPADCRMRVLRLTPLAAIALLTACGPGARERVAPPGAKIAPFAMHLDGAIWTVPDRPDLHQATFYEDWSPPTLRIEVCFRKGKDSVPECEGLGAPLVNSNGVSTFVTIPDASYSLLTEKPDGPGPPPVPLITIAGDQIDTDIGGSGEAYELSRVRLGGRVRLSTTDRGWPVVACSVGYSGSRGCRIGFLIGNAFVEAGFHATDEAIEHNQAEVWAVATALDSKLRELRTLDSLAPNDR